MAKVAIIDYKLSNLFSVEQALKLVGLKAVITAKSSEIKKAKALVLPGVGAFGDAMENLKKFKLIEPIKDSIYSGKPFLGICLGMQLLFSESEEFGKHKGLDVIKGKVIQFKGKAAKKIKVPQIGWNRINKPNNQKKDIWGKSPLAGIKKGEFMYFVHSYYVCPRNKKVVLTETNYEGVNYCSAILKDNVFATQFHPEKSGKKGIAIYKNWAKLIN